MKNRNAFAAVALTAKLLLWHTTSSHAAAWAGFVDRSTNLMTSTFSFTGDFPAAGDSNENYYDGDMADFDGDGWMDRALIARYGLLQNTDRKSTRLNSSHVRISYAA